jgi:vacuolar-type H+-ATPase subunit H
VHHGSHKYARVRRTIRTLRIEEAEPVPYVTDFLSRFRPAASPGAGRAAVPADRQRERESELGPVLAALDGPSAERADLVAKAQRDAEQIVAAARREAEEIVSAARRRAADLATELARRAVATADAEASAIVAAGAAEAAAVADRARQRLPALADRAVTLIRDLAQPDRSP